MRWASDNPGMNRIPKSGWLALAPVLSACLFQTEKPAPQYGPGPLAGGTMTHFDATSGAFSAPAPNLSPEDLAHHEVGDGFFADKFVAAPAPINPGLGPLHNNSSCESCHPRDGRGRPPEPGQAMSSMLFRISAAGTDAQGGPKPMPGYGGQLQTRAIFGEDPEASIAISYRDSIVSLAGNVTGTLRVPVYALQNPWQPLSEAPLLSPRVAPPVFGLGLLEAVRAAEILAHADPDDGDGDGISGRPNYVYGVRAGTRVLGRFGWKANVPDLEQQNAGAFNQDMGITSPLLPEENCAGDRPACASHPPDIDSAVLEAVSFYIRTLAVPARRDWRSRQVRQGESLFVSAGCPACHARELQTGPSPGMPGLAAQTIHPFTDLLLHDMGDGLADGRPDYEADGREWRTAPLWGIGLTKVVSGHTFFLHDGRARNLMEAILWHGGEAERAQRAVRGMIHEDRRALVAFLESL